MSVVMTVGEAQAEFLALLKQVRQGDEVIIAQDGKPIARVVPVAASAVRRQPGTAAGQVVMHADFDEPLPPDILDDFEK
ncbi:hypothetical protein ARNL5_03298 [Anaerolineae bacterium]|nr:hypothetical protein ARNL5_03298 [Anaerolineae bacterium]